MTSGSIETRSPEETFDLGRRLAAELGPGDIVLLYGGLGAGKTLLTKGIMQGLGYDDDEVTSPSFTLVNEYKTRAVDVYHIDLWRLEVSTDVPGAVSLDEILENERAMVIIEWADRLGDRALPGRTVRLEIAGDGDEPRQIITSDHRPAAGRLEI